MITIAERPLASFLATGDGRRPIRDGYGHALLELGRQNKDIVVLDADLSRSTRTEWWAESFPDRFFNVGIAEQNLIGISAGLSTIGFIPFATTYAIFVARAFDQIRQSVSYSGANVKIIGAHGGYAASYDGGSHQGLEDISLMRVLPGMTVLCPIDYSDTVQAIHWAARHRGPVYIRLQKEASANFTDAKPGYDVTGATQWGTGHDVCIVATGSRVHDALVAAARLEAQGVDARVIGVTCLKPFDEAIAPSLADGVRHVITVEEHMINGGLFQVVCTALRGTGLPVSAIAAPDEFGETASWEQLLKKYHMDADGIFATAVTRLEHSSERLRRTAGAA